MCDKEIESGDTCNIFCDIVLSHTRDNIDMQNKTYMEIMGLDEEWKEEDTGNEYCYEDYLDEYREIAKNRLKKKHNTKKGESIYKVMVEMKAREMLKDSIEEWQRNPETREYAKMIKLEIKYERRRQLEKMKFRIETLTGRKASGRYTLQEVGDVLFLTRERVRQIEQKVIGTYDSKKGHHVGGMFTSPHSARLMRKYIHD